MYNVLFYFIALQGWSFCIIYCSVALLTADLYLQ